MDIDAERKFLRTACVIVVIFSLLKLSPKKFLLSTISEDILFHIKIEFGMKGRTGLVVRVLVETRKVLAKI